MRNLLLIGTGLPDTWAGVVNELPAGVKPRIAQDIENLLDREEIRRIDVVAYGTGALEAVSFAGRQPQRVGKLVLVDPVLDIDRRALRLVPGFLLPGKRKLIDALTTASSQIPHITAEVTVLGESRNAAQAASLLGVPAQPGGADYRVDPAGFVAEICGPLGL